MWSRRVDVCVWTVLALAAICFPARAADPPEVCSNDFKAGPNVFVVMAYSDGIAIAPDTVTLTSPEVASVHFWVSGTYFYSNGNPIAGKAEPFEGTAQDIGAPPFSLFCARTALGGAPVNELRRVIGKSNTFSFCQRSTGCARFPGDYTHLRPQFVVLLVDARARTTGGGRGVLWGMLDSVFGSEAPVAAASAVVEADRPASRYSFQFKNLDPVWNDMRTRADGHSLSTALAVDQLDDDKALYVGKDDMLGCSKPLRPASEWPFKFDESDSAQWTCRLLPKLLRGALKKFQPL